MGTCVTTVVSLPHYHPSDALNDVNKILKEIFEKMVASGFTSVVVSVDDTATWPLNCFVQRSLCSFVSFVRDPCHRSTELNLSLQLCSTVNENIQNTRKICDDKLTRAAAVLNNTTEGKV